MLNPAAGNPQARPSSTTAFAKSTRPELIDVVQREALFARLDGTAQRTLAWIFAPPGFGKTTLVASYLEARGYRWAWYQVDADDADGETFFHYLAHATRRQAPSCRLSALSITPISRPSRGASSARCSPQPTGRSRWCWTTCPNLLTTARCAPSSMLA